MAAAGFALLLAIVQWWALDTLVPQDLVRGAVAGAALAALGYERARRHAGRPVPVKIRKRAGVALAVAATCAFVFTSVPDGLTRWYSLWDVYHYYMGAKYFPELRYDGLYRCAIVAQSELGPAREGGAVVSLTAEVTDPRMTYREARRGHTILPAVEALASAEECRARFSPARWEAFRGDVRFFRLAIGAPHWSAVHGDYGFNPPPVWLVLGKPLATWVPASVGWLRAAAMLDVALLAGALALLGCTFGWRAFAVGTVFYGCSYLNTFFWPGASLLRQDWLFLLVLTACLLRLRRYGAAGAAFAWAGLLRVFPLLMGLGLLAQAVVYVARRRRLPREHLRFAAGAALAAAVLVPASLAVTGGNPYPAFVANLRLLDSIPLVNHVGLRPAASHGWSGAGRMEYAVDNTLADPISTWKEVRAERWRRVRPVALGVAGIALLWFCWVAGRVRWMWVALCIGPLVVILGAQLFSYYYAFPMLAAPLVRVRWGVAWWLVGFAAVSEIVAAALRYGDDRFAVISVLAMGFGVGVVAAVGGRGRGTAPNG